MAALGCHTGFADLDRECRAVAALGYSVGFADLDRECRAINRARGTWLR